MRKDCPTSLSNRTEQTGLTLVELLIGMVLGIFVMAGILQLMVISKATYRLQEAVSRVQENGRYAIDLIARDIRTAGYAGCLRLADVLPPFINTTFNADNFLWGFDSLATGNLLGATPLTDSLTVRAMSPDALPLTTNMAAADSTISVAARGLDWDAGDLMIVSNCEAFDLFIALSMSGTGPVSITPAAPLSRTYPSGSLVGPFRVFTYAVKPDTSNANIPSLWRIEIRPDTGAVVESPVAEGVTNIQVRYLSGSDYVTASSITNWSSVKAVRISLLVESLEENVLPESRSVYFNGTMSPDTSGTRRMRQVFNTTAGTRNNLQ